MNNESFKMLLYKAMNVKTDPETLYNLTKLNNPFINEAVAYNPNTRIDTFNYLLSLNDNNINLAILHNKKAPQDIISKFANVKNEELKLLFLRHPNVPESELYNIIDSASNPLNEQDIKYLKEIARNPYVGSKVLFSIIKFKNNILAVTACKTLGKIADYNTVNEFAKGDSLIKKLIAAGSKNISEQNLNLLLKDTSRIVRDHATITAMEKGVIPMNPIYKALKQSNEKQKYIPFYQRMLQLESLKSTKNNKPKISH